MKKFFYLLSLILLFTVGCGEVETEQSTGSQDVKVEVDLEENSTIEENETFNDEASETPVVDPVSLYYVDNDLMNIYRISEDTSLPKNEDGVKVALERWINGPVPEGLQRNIPEGVTVQSVNSNNGVLYVSFSNDLLNANLGSSGEAFLIDQITMIVEQFGFKQTKILIDEEEKETLLGHIDLSEPFEAKSPTEFETFN